MYRTRSTLLRNLHLAHILFADPAGDAGSGGGTNPGGTGTAGSGAPATDDPPAGETPGDGDDGDGDADEAGADQLGDKGKQALDRMKAKWQAERDKRRQLEQQLTGDKPAAKKPSDEAGAGTGAQVDVDQILAKAERDAQARAGKRILRSEVKAAAAGKLNDPADALRLLDLDQFEVDENGDVDEDEIAEAIADLVAKKPYLAAQGGKRFQGSADGGSRKDSRPKQLTREDLKGMNPAAILKARQDGQLADLLKG